MAVIPVVNFQPDTLAQSNGYLTGLQAALQNQLLRQQGSLTGAKAQTQGIENQYLPNKLQQSLLTQQLNNQILQPQAQYAPQITQADLAYKQAQTPNLQAQTGLTNQQAQWYGPSAQSEIALKQSQIPLNQASAQAKPYQALGEYYAGLGRYGMSSYYNNPITQGLRALNNPGTQALASSNPTVNKNIGDLLYGIYSRAAQPPGQGMSGNPQQPGTPMMQPNQVSPSGSSPYQGNSPYRQPGQPPTPMGMPNQQPQQNNSGLTPQDYAQLAQTYGDSAQKKTVPNAIAMQRFYSASYDEQMKPWIPKIPEIANYAGAAGKAKLTIDKYMASLGLGQDSPQYQDWNSFVNAAAPLASNEYRRSLGITSSVHQQQEWDKLSDPAYWNEHPSDALARWNALLAAKKANDKAIFNNPSQISSQGRADTQQPATQYATKPGMATSLGDGQYSVITKDGKSRVITDAQIKSTADANNLTVQEIKQRFGIR